MNETPLHPGNRSGSTLNHQTKGIRIALLFIAAFLAAAISASAQTTTYTWSNLAGTPGTAGLADGTGTNAQFGAPTGIAVGPDGLIYVTDNDSYLFNGYNTIRTVTTGGAVTTRWGGQGSTIVSSNWIALDSGSNMYEEGGNQSGINQVTQSGIVTPLTFVTPGGASLVPGIAQGIAVDSGGDLYVADSDKKGVLLVNSVGVGGILAGELGVSGSFNGTGTNATFAAPLGVAVDSAGNVYVADEANEMIRKITSGSVSTLAGSGTPALTDGTGANASFWEPTGIAVDSAGNVYVADNVNNAIRKVTPSGVVTTIGGSPAGLSGTATGTGSNAQFNRPWGIAVDNAGNVYVTDSNNFRIMKGVPMISGGVPAMPVWALSSLVFLLFGASGWFLSKKNWLSAH